MIAPLSIHWLTSALLGSTVLMVGVLLLRRPVARAFGVEAAYLLWLAPAFRTVMPVFERPAATEIVLPDVPLPMTSPKGWMLDATPTAMTVLGQVLLGIWMLGAALFIVVHILRYVGLRRSILANGGGMGQVDGIRLIRSAAAPGPLAFGFFTSIVVLPDDFEQRFTQAEQRQVIAHEMAHHTGLDIWTNLIAFIVLALHWFNPVAWVAWRAFRRDQEARCDARVLRGDQYADRLVYAQALAKAAIGGDRLPRPLAATISNRNDLKERLMLIKHLSATTPRRSLAGRAMALTLTLIGSAATVTVVNAQPAANPAAGDVVIERKIVPIDAAPAAQPNPNDRLVAIHPDQGAVLGPNPIRIAREDGGEPMLVRCKEEPLVSDVTEQGAGPVKRQMFIMCARPGEQPMTPAMRLDALRTARERIAGQADFPADMKPRVLARLDAQIAALGGAND